MRLKYGAYFFAINATSVKQWQEQCWNDGGQLLSYRRFFEVEGTLYSITGQTGVTAAMVELEAALAIANQDLLMYQDNGDLSATILPNATSLGGVQVQLGPDYPDSTNTKGYIYSSGQFFRFRASAEYPYAGTELLKVSFHETLEFFGGSPLNVVRPATNTIPQAQNVYGVTPFYCTQSGMAVGYRQRPNPNAMLFPNNLVGMNPVRIRKEDPKRENFGSYSNYKIYWTYNFGSTTPFPVTEPTLWIN